MSDFLQLKSEQEIREYIQVHSLEDAYQEYLYIHWENGGKDGLPEDYDCLELLLEFISNL